VVLDACCCLCILESPRARGLLALSGASACMCLRVPLRSMPTDANADRGKSVFERDTGLGTRMLPIAGPLPCGVAAWAGPPGPQDAQVGFVMCMVETLTQVHTDGHVSRGARGHGRNTGWRLRPPLGRRVSVPRSPYPPPLPTHACMSGHACMSTADTNRVVQTQPGHPAALSAVHQQF